MRLNFSRPKQFKLVHLLIGILSIVSISAGYIFAGETIYLPMLEVEHPEPTQTLTPTLTLTPTVTQTPTVTATLGPTATPTETATIDPNITPIPPGTLYLIVTPANPDKAWALCYFVKTYNDAGRPVMEIYPGDSSPADERIKIPEDTLVLAYDVPVLADGGGKFWKLVDYVGREGEELFLRAEDITKQGFYAEPDAVGSDYNN